jgi:hypothetical protein
VAVATDSKVVDRTPRGAVLGQLPTAGAWRVTPAARRRCQEPQCEPGRHRREAVIAITEAEAHNSVTAKEVSLISTVPATPE